MANSNFVAVHILSTYVRMCMFNSLYCVNENMFQKGELLLTYSLFNKNVSSFLNHIAWLFQ